MVPVPTPPRIGNISNAVRNEENERKEKNIVENKNKKKSIDEIRREIREMELNRNNRQEKNLDVKKDNPNNNDFKCSEPEIKENRGENRSFINRNLRDLIKILIIRELLGSNRPSRPPHRPPFSGSSGIPRPPRPRSNNLYE